MIRLPVLSVLILMVLMTISSCDDYPYDYECTCPHGGYIGGWEESGDTTSVDSKDTTGGFEVTLEHWNGTETHDIPL